MPKHLKYEPEFIESSFFAIHDEVLITTDGFNVVPDLSGMVPCTYSTKCPFLRNDKYFLSVTV